jgi:hypothetical protein
MCIFWDRQWKECGHYKPTNMYLQCHEYRHTRICEVEDTRVIHKQGKCPDYRDNEDGAAGENLERDRSGEN